MLDSFVFVRGENHEGEEIRVRKILVLFRCVVRVDKRSDETAFLQFMECEPPLSAVYGASRCVHLRWRAAKDEEHETEVSK